MIISFYFLLLLLLVVLFLVIFVVGGFPCIDDAVIVVVGGGGRLLLRLRLTCAIAWNAERETSAQNCLSICQSRLYHWIIINFGPAWQRSSVKNLHPLVPFFTRGLSSWAYESCRLTLIVFSNFPWKIAIVRDKLYSLAPTWIISVCTMAYFLQHRMQWIISGRKLFPFSVSRAVFVTEELIREVGTNKTVNNVTDPLTSLSDED